MAITLNDVVLEGLRRAGQTRPGAESVKRASEVWIPEIVNEVVTAARRTGIGFLELFDVTALAIGVTNRSRYALPTDYDDRLSVTLLYGDHQDTMLSATESTLTLAADEDLTEADAIGYYVLMTSGTSAGQYRQIIDFDDSGAYTVVYIEEPWDAGKTPLAGDTYMIVDTTYDIPCEYVREQERIVRQVPGLPTTVAVHRGEFVFDCPLDQVYGIKLRYYADPGRIALTDDRWDTIALRWQNYLTLAIEYRMLKELDDSRTQYVLPEAAAALAAVITREQRDYGDFEGACLPANY